MAALKTDGVVVTWGQADRGGDSRAVAAQLAKEVRHVAAGDVAMAALKTDGAVVTLGDAGNGGDSRAVAAQLAGAV